MEKKTESTDPPVSGQSAEKKSKTGASLPPSVRNPHDSQVQETSRSEPARTERIAVEQKDLKRKSQESLPVLPSTPKLKRQGESAQGSSASVSQDIGQRSLSDPSTSVVTQSQREEPVRLIQSARPRIEPSSHLTSSSSIFRPISAGPEPTTNARQNEPSDSQDADSESSSVAGLSKTSSSRSQEAASARLPSTAPVVERLDLSQLNPESDTSTPDSLKESSLPRLDTSHSGRSISPHPDSWRNQNEPSRLQNCLREAPTAGPSSSSQPQDAASRPLPADYPVVEQLDFSNIRPAGGIRTPITSYCMVDPEVRSNRSLPTALPCNPTLPCTWFTVFTTQPQAPPQSTVSFHSRQQRSQTPHPLAMSSEESSVQRSEGESTSSALPERSAAGSPSGVVSFNAPGSSRPYNVNDPSNYEPRNLGEHYRASAEEVLDDSHEPPHFSARNPSNSQQWHSSSQYRSGQEGDSQPPVIRHQPTHLDTPWPQERPATRQNVILVDNRNNPTGRQPFAPSTAASTISSSGPMNFARAFVSAFSNYTKRPAISVPTPEISLPERIATPPSTSRDGSPNEPGPSS